MSQNSGDKQHRPASDHVAIILASGIAISLILITVALLWVAVVRFTNGGNLGLSENGTQLLTGWGGGIIGVLGSYVGYTFGKRKAENGKEEGDGTDTPPVD